MKMTKTFGKYEFSKPLKIIKWEPPELSGLYAILKPDIHAEGLPVTPIYFGQTGNFAERGFIKSHEKYKDWIREAFEEEHIFIAIYLMPDSTEKERKVIEAELVKEYNPVCNRE